MEPAKVRISVRSRRHAMDWSLVLVSQGIETTIEHAQEGALWGLIVASQDYERAMHAIHQYRKENHNWPWRQEVFQQGLLFDWGSLAWVLMLAVFFWLDTGFGLSAAGLMDSIEVSHGQLWRLFTAVWLHADLAHLASNAVIGCILLGLTMGRYGTGLGLLAAYLAGAGGNGVAWLLPMGHHRSLGASGMVMACLGLLAVQSFSLWRLTPHASKHMVRGVCAGVMLFVLMGLTPGTDIMAHAGGFLSGLLIGSLLSLAPNMAQNSRINLLSGLFFVLLVILPWWRALESIKLR